MESMDMTQQFLEKCKEAGYEVVAIFVKDKRVPFTRKIKEGEWWGMNETDDEGNLREVYPHKVVCGHPQRLGTHPNYQGSGWPKMWSIVKELGLIAGLTGGGSGFGDAHEINKMFIERLTAGCYEL